MSKSSGKKRNGNKKKGWLISMLMNPIVLLVIGALVGAILTIGGQAVYDLIRDSMKPKPNTEVYVQQTSDGWIITASNLGKATDKVEIKVGALSYFITDYHVTPAGGQIRLINGGPNGNYAIFMIDELLPDTWRAITLVTKADKLDELSAWSEYVGDIKVNKTPITIEFGPEESYEEWQRKQ
jgi:hypothetical protein